MKKTVIFKKIDGHEIIVGFSRPTIDPVETNRIVNEAIKNTSEWQAVEAKKAEYGEAAKEFLALKIKIKSMKASEKKRISSQNNEHWNTLLGKMSVRQDELKPLARDLADKLTALRLENAVHFTPRVGEVIRDASDVKRLSQDMQDRAQGTEIALDGSTVEDNRGKVFFRKSGGKWGRTHIVRLGDPVPGDATLQADVTPEQAIEIERDLIAALPADIKLKEKERALSRAIRAAATMRNELEIQADPDALTKSQDWYKIELTRINTLYK